MFRAPTQTPNILTLLDDMPTQDRRLIARHLGISARTLARWAASGEAPRLAHLALFWESRWGLSVAHCSAENGERIALALARSLERETAMLRARIAFLEETGDFGAANAPLWGHAGPAPRRLTSTDLESIASMPGTGPRPARPAWHRQ